MFAPATEITLQPLKGMQVLLVEDEPNMAVSLTDVLEHSGAAVIAATTALEALQVLAVQRPQILVCNLRLPDLEGTHLLEQVRQAPDTALRQLPALAVTSSSREYSAAALKAGFDYFLAKPIEPAPLIEAILQLIA
jgi:CheY-like chemotaxis protein